MASYAGLDAKQAKKAVAALLKHVNKGKQGQQDSLFDEDEIIYLVKPLSSCRRDPLGLLRLPSLYEAHTWSR